MRGLDPSESAPPAVLVPGGTIAVGPDEMSAEQRDGRRRERKRLAQRAARDAQRAATRQAELPRESLARGRWPRKAERAQRKVDPIGNISYANAVYNVGRAWKGQLVDVFTVGDKFYVACGDSIVRSHPIAHDRQKETAALRDGRR
jgi:hypothetical protein